jgi:hypothetical protein
MAKAKESYTPATTPEDNGYCPQAGQFDYAYSGDLTDFGPNKDDYEERDAKVNSTRKEFGKAIPAGTGPALSSGHDLD